VKNHFGAFAEPEHPDPNVPAFMRQRGKLTTTKEWETLDAYYNLDNGTGKVRGVYTQENFAVAPIFRQWIAPLADLGVNGDLVPKHRRHGSPVVRCGRPAGLPVHSGPDGL